MVRVNHVEFQFLFHQRLLHLARQVIPHHFRPVQAVQQEHAARARVLEHVKTLQEGEIVAGHKVGVAFADEIRGANGLGAKAQMRNRHRAGFLGIVHKVALAKVAALFADDLDGVLVGAHRAVRAQAKEHAAHRLIPFDGEGRVIAQAGVADVVVNAHGEMVLGFGFGHLGKNALHHARRKFFRGQTVTPAQNPRGAGKGRQAFGRGFLHRRHHVQIQRLAAGTGLFGAVQHRQGAHRGRQSLNEMRDGEGPVQMHRHHAHLLTPRRQNTRRLFGCLGPRAHDHNHPFRVRRTGVIKEVIGAARERRELIHGRLHVLWAGRVKGVDRLTPLEIHILILQRAADERPLRV